MNTLPPFTLDGSQNLMRLKLRNISTNLNQHISQNAEIGKQNQRHGVPLFVQRSDNWEHIFSVLDKTNRNINIA